MYNCSIVHNDSFIPFIKLNSAVISTYSLMQPQEKIQPTRGRISNLFLIMQLPSVAKQQQKLFLDIMNWAKLRIKYFTRHIERLSHTVFDT